MATTLYLRDVASTLGGAGQKTVSATSGKVPITTTTTTTASGTNIQITETGGGQVLSWFSEPLTNAVTISGSITQAVRCRESANSVNSGIALLLERCNNAGVVQSTILPRAVIGTEAATTQQTRTAARTPTLTAMSVGDRFKITLSVINVGTMGAGTFNVYYDNPAETNAAGSFLRFTEDFLTDQIMDVPAFLIIGNNGYKG